MEIGSKNHERNTRRSPIVTIVALTLALIAIIIVAIAHKTIRAWFRPEETNTVAFGVRTKIKEYVFF